MPSSEAENCKHVNVYRDDFKSDWHCDDCGKCFGPSPPPDVGFPPDTTTGESDG